jgi:hypothetical protein
MMVYITQDYWVIGLCQSSVILKNTGEHKVSETGCFRSHLCVCLWANLIQAIQ